MKVGIAWCAVAFTTAMASRPRQQQCHKHKHKDLNAGITVANLISATVVLKGSKIVPKSDKGGRPRIFGEQHQNPALEQVLQDYKNFDNLFNKPPKKRQGLQPLQGDVGPDPIYVDAEMGSIQSMSDSNLDKVIEGIYAFEACIKQLVEECGFLPEAARKALGVAQGQDGQVNEEVLNAEYAKIKEVLKDVDLVSMSDNSLHLEATFEPIIHQEVSFQLMKERYPQSEDKLRTFIFKAEDEELPSLFFSSMLG